jgi:DNA-directed RNA polymerase subunit RPC12/RpoP
MEISYLCSKCETGFTICLHNGDEIAKARDVLCENCFEGIETKNDACLHFEGSE